MKTVKYVGDVDIVGYYPKIEKIEENSSKLLSAIEFIEKDPDLFFISFKSGYNSNLKPNFYFENSKIFNYDYKKLKGYDIEVKKTPSLCEAMILFDKMKHLSNVI